MAYENKPIFPNVDPKWGGREEMLLLDAIEKHGHGNWKTTIKYLSDITGKEFTVEEVEEHYNRIYIHGNIGKETWNYEYVSSTCLTLQDDTCNYDASILSNSDVYTAENVPKHHLRKLRYMPLRDDFEKDYDMGAEAILDEIEFYSNSDKPPQMGDNDLVKALELAIVQIYRRQIRERYRKREIIKKYRLVEQYCQLGHSIMKGESLKRKKNSFITEAVSEFLELACFARFFSHEEFQKFFQLSLKERILKKKIEELIALRESGVTEIEDMDETESMKSKIFKMDDSIGPNPNLGEILLHLLDEENTENESACSQEKDEDDCRYEKAPCISVLQGYNLLSQREKMLCTALKLRPAYYIAYKTVLIFADVEKQKGNSIQSFNLRPHGLDKEQCLQIVNFMAENAQVLIISAGYVKWKTSSFVKSVYSLI